jgi:hypothetical protein
VTDDLGACGRKRPGPAAVVAVRVRDDHVSDRLVRGLLDLFENGLAGRRVAARVHRDDLLADEEPADVGALTRLGHPDALRDLLTEATSPPGR